MKRAASSLVFVTGTGTGVGKTVLTTLLLAFLRGQGKKALAVKPFCSGARADAETLWACEKECLTLDEVNPFYFDRPLAPLAAAPAGRLPRLRDVVKYLRQISSRSQMLLIEGSGGLLVPLGTNYTAADVIVALRCPVIVVARNALGTINHTMLTLKHLQRIGVQRISVVLMSQPQPDLSAASNSTILGKMAPEIGLVELPFLGFKPLREREIKKSVTFLQKTLAQILDQATVSLLARKGGFKDE